MWSLPLAALLFAAPAAVAAPALNSQACIDQVRDTCLKEISKCPRPVDLAPTDRSCLSCGVTWLRGELAPDALETLVTAIHKATKSPITVIEVWAPQGKTTARVHAVVNCAPGSAAGDIFLFVKNGPRWKLKSRSSWIE
jgi:hypothetical protein